MAIDHRTVRVGQTVHHKGIDLGIGDSGTETYTVLSAPELRYGSWWCFAKRNFTGYREWISLDSCHEQPIRWADDDDSDWP